MEKKFNHNSDDPISQPKNKLGTSETRSKFEEHWHDNALQEIGVNKLAEAKEFLEIVFNQIEKTKAPISILDVGCGDGVHKTALAQAEVGRFVYFGMDISFEAIKLASIRPNGHSVSSFHFQTGDALSLPYCSNTFDVVFSYGVIAYTGAPEQAFDEMIRVCKPGGLVGIWIYPKMEGIVGKLFNFTRSLCHWLGKKWSKVVIYPIVLLLPALPVRSGINLFNSTWQQCVEVVEVNLLPKELGFYTLNDVLEWCERRNLDVQFIDDKRPVSVWACV